MDDLQILWPERAEQQKMRASLTRQTGCCMQGLHERCGAVVLRGINSFEAREHREAALVEPLRHQGALATLGLIGGIGRHQLA